MKRLISTYISAMLLLTGCDPMVPEYPTSGPPVEFSVYLSADLTPPAVYKEITYTKGHGRNVVTRSTPAPDYYFDNSQHLLRFIVEVYDGNRREAESDPGRLVGRQEIITEIDARAPQCKASFTLPHGDYTIVGWSDYANKQDPGKLIYDCSNLYEITYATAPIEDNHS